MTWLKIDDRAFDDPKLVGLSDTAHLAVLRSWIYAAKHETDGYVPAAIVAALTHGKRRFVDEILAGGLWQENGAGFVIHNFTKYNPTRETLRAKRAADSERKRRGVRP